MSASFEPFNLTLNTCINSFCAVSSIKARTVSNASLGEFNGNSGRTSFQNTPFVLHFPDGRLGRGALGCVCGLWAAEAQMQRERER